MNGEGAVFFYFFIFHTAFLIYFLFVILFPVILFLFYLVSNGN
jgi:hypothetical protein